MSSIRASWIALATLTVGCSPVVQQQPTVSDATTSAERLDDTLVQFSLISALATGDYADGVPLRDVLAGGDFGVGTFYRLEGEMIVLDGQMYQALADGTVRKADLMSSTPFAAVTSFQEDGRIDRLAAPSLADLERQLDQQLSHRNSPYALRIDGEFTTLTLRSVPAQTPPFLPLVEVVKSQTTWQHRNVRGTMIGVRCPQWVGTLNVAGYHWHFLSEDKAIGGHVLACQFQEALLRYDLCTSLLIHVPQSQQFDSFESNAIKHDDIHQIERQRDPPARP